MKRVIMKAIPAAVLLAASLSAQALTPGSGAWVKEAATYGTPNLQNAYVYVPKNVAPQVLAGKRALMLTMHGCGQTASGNVINHDFNWEDTAEKYGMVVIAPTVPSGTSATRSVSGCWDWFGTGQTRTNRDQVPLKKLLDAVMTRANLDIDPNQVYVTGLSSGAGETLAMGCAFPDIFAGFGSNAGPVIGAAAGDISVAPKLSAAQIAANCKSYSGSAYVSYYNTQIFSTVYGDKDTLVLPAHNTTNLAGMGAVYGVTVSNPVTSTVTGGGTAKVYKDANGKERLSDLVVAGMAHAWPAGTGATANIAYVDSTRVNYPVYIADWFFKNNLRVVIIQTPAGLTVGGATNSSLALTWSAVSGATSYNVYRDGTKVGSAAGTSYTDTGLNAGSTYSYTVTAVGSGSESAKQASAVQGTTTGSPPVLAAPSGLVGSSPGTGTVALTWNVVAGAKNYNVYRNGAKIASPVAASYSDSGLASGSYNYTVSTVNSANIEGAQSAAVPVSPVAYSASVTATVVSHYSAGRLTLSQYLGLGAKIGYSASVTLYNCSGTWTNQANCSALSY